MDQNMLGKNLGALLKAKGMTQHDLAHHLDLPDSTISLWVHGKRKPHACHRRLICEILHIEEQQLFNPQERLKTDTSLFGTMFSE